jgi:2-haloacid dehalogenase
MFREELSTPTLLTSSGSGFGLDRAQSIEPPSFTRFSSRRQFLGNVAAAGFLTVSRAEARTRRPKAIAFDAFPILDPSSVFALGEKLFPGKGADLATAWRTRQFEYTWLRTMARRYEGFWQVTEDALVFAAHALKLDLTSDKRERLMGAYLEIRCWPDVPAALQTLKSAGIRLGFLSNMTEKMLQAGIRNSGLEGLFEFVLSTDRVKAFKPDPRAYQMAIDALGMKRDEIVFAAFAGWDAAGAKTFGYPTFWVNRQNQPPEELGVSADATGQTLQDLVRYTNA